MKKTLVSIKRVGDLIDTVSHELGRLNLSTASDEPSPASSSVDAVEDDIPLATERLHEIAEVLETNERISRSEDSIHRLPYYIEHESAATSTTRVDGRELLSFSSYNYLGLAAHPLIIDKVSHAVSQFGTSASTARILSGNRPLHTQLERSIAHLVGTEDAVALVGGHSTNASIIPHLYGPHDLILHDSLVHDSIHQGIKTSGSTRHSYAHNDIDNLTQALKARRSRFRRVLIVTEGVFSMDGDIADLPRLLQVTKDHDAHIMVDEAHSVGVLGQKGGGICEELDVDPAEIDILMGTLSKSLASCGGYIAGRSALIQHLRFTLSSLVFSAAMTPANAAASLHAIELMREEPERLKRLRRNARYFLEGARARGLDTGNACGVPVVPVILGSSEAAIDVAEVLNTEGVSVNPIIYPAVAESLARLRFFITSEHTTQQLDHALERTVRAVRRAATQSGM